MLWFTEFWVTYLLFSHPWNPFLCPPSPKLGKRYVQFYSWKWLKVWWQTNTTATINPGSQLIRSINGKPVNGLMMENMSNNWKEQIMDKETVFKISLVWNTPAWMKSNFGSCFKCQIWRNFLQATYSVFSLMYGCFVLKENLLGSPSLPWNI